MQILHQCMFFHVCILRSFIAFVLVTMLMFIFLMAWKTKKVPDAQRFTISVVL